MEAMTLPGCMAQQERALTEYRLAVFPGRELAALLGAEMAYGTACYGKALRWVEKPAIELLRFQARPEMEDTLLRWMLRICCQSERFPVAINNYGSQPACPLYLRLQDDRPLRQLSAGFRTLDGWLKSNGLGSIRLQPPRLVLVSSLDPLREREILLDFSSRMVAGSMAVEELVLFGGEGRLVSRLPLSLSYSINKNI